MSKTAPPTDVYRAIADPTRRSILDSLRETDQTAGEIAEGFSMTREAVSQHLKMLRDAHLIKSRQVGRYRIYTIDAGGLHDVFQWASTFSAFWDDRLDRLEVELANRRKSARKKKPRKSKN